MDDLYWVNGCLRAGSLGNPPASRHEGRKMKEKLIRVAVYGTLMTGERNEHWGADARRRVPCTIRGVLYDTGWGFPAFVPDEHGRDVVAELLDVTPETLARLDVLEGYPELYVRETVAATLADGSVVEAMVYVMRKLPEGARIVGRNRDKKD
jgi:gamma-glutamylcyclotransferase (GGCT)/AIG2-like uncharacterized protein YtfP